MVDLIIQGKRLNGIDLVIFDKDGTLFELFPYWTVVAHRRAENICHRIHEDNHGALVEWIMTLMGVNIQNRSMNPEGPIGIFNRTYIENLIVIELQKQGYPVNAQIVADAFQETDIYISDNEILRQSLVTVRGLLFFLQSISLQCQCAIFSYDQTINLKHITQLMGMESYFSLLLGGDKILHPKPDPWGAVKIMQDLDVSADRTILIGDSIHDIESGRKAGCHYVITRRSDISDLPRMTPLSDFIIRDYTEITVGN